MLRLTRAQVREIDRRAIEEYHIPGIVLMENAARAVVAAAIEMLPPTKEVCILCGLGNNAGDGFAVARHLHNRGLDPAVILVYPPETLRGDALLQYQIIDKMGVCRLHAYNFGKTEHFLNDDELWIDGLFGTGLTRAPDGLAAEMIRVCNQSKGPRLAIDVPSGMDCDTGNPLDVCIRAARTVTFVAEKAGFANPESKKFTGDVIVADIGVPRELIDDIARPAR